MIEKRETLRDSPVVFPRFQGLCTARQHQDMAPSRVAPIDGNAFKSPDIPVFHPHLLRKAYYVQSPRVSGWILKIFRHISVRLTKPGQKSRHRCLKTHVLRLLRKRASVTLSTRCTPCLTFSAHRQQTGSQSPLMQRLRLVPHKGFRPG